MPKMKTHKASKKRFRVTATGKLKRSQAGKKHLNSHKTGKRKRHLRGSVVDGGKLSRKYIKHDGRRSVADSGRTGATSHDTSTQRQDRPPGPQTDAQADQGLPR